MKKMDNSFYNIIRKIINVNFINKAKTFLKENYLISIIAYIVGTAALLFRNKTYGLQFVPLSLLQYVVMTIYFLFFLYIYAAVEKTFVIIVNVIKNKEKEKINIILGRIFTSLLLLIVLEMALYYLIGENTVAIAIEIFYYIILPVMTTFYYKNDYISTAFTIVFFIIILLYIPMQLGGLKGQEVKFHEYNTNEIKEYTYYGNYDDLYQFVSDDKVYLIPIESGYIEYQK